MLLQFHLHWGFKNLSQEPEISMIYTESGHVYYVDQHAYVTTFIFNDAKAEKFFQKKLI